jgi:lactoylglutathione lyase
MTKQPPAGWQSITPRIVVEDAAVFISFLQVVFGATGEFNADAPSQISIGDSRLMISEAGEREPFPAFLYVYVDDVDATYARAIDAECESIETVRETPYGDRRGMVKDAWDNVWQFATRAVVEDDAEESTSPATEEEAEPAEIVDEPGSGPLLVTQAVPFFWVRNISASLSFYIDGIGFRKTREWIDEGMLKWCWLELGETALMLQELAERGRYSSVEAGGFGLGVSINFNCTDSIAMYHEMASRGLEPDTPFVGNGLWVTQITDPDGYALSFNTPTSEPEETLYQE